MTQHGASTGVTALLVIIEATAEGIKAGTVELDPREPAAAQAFELLQLGALRVFGLTRMVPVARFSALLTEPAHRPFAHELVACEWTLD